MINKYKRQILLSIMPSFILSVAHVLGFEYLYYDIINIHSPLFYVACIALTVVFMIILIAIERFVAFLDEKRVGNAGWFKVIENKEMLVSFSILLFLWLPAFFAMWPGLYSYDAPGRLANYFSSSIISAHFPVLHTLLMIGSVEIGQNIGIGADGGVLIYSIIQAVVMSFCISYMLSFIWRKMKCKYLALISLVLLGINPVIQIMVFTTTHDIIFGGVMLVMMVLLTDAAIYSEEFFESKAKMISLSMMALLMCMFRNQGIYMLVLLLPFAIIAWKNYRIKVTIILLIPIIITKIITGPVYSSLGIQGVNPREALCLPIQQLAHTATHNPDRISEEEYIQIYKYIPREYLQLYNSGIADPVKSGFDSEEFRRSPLDFVTVWIKVGINNPTAYLTAFVAEGYGYYYLFDTAYYDRFIVWDYENMPEPQVRRDTKLPFYEKYLEDITYDGTYKGIPVISQALPFTLMMICVYFSLLRKKYKLLSLLVLPLGYFGTLLIGPVIGIRYVFPLLIMVPLFLGLTIGEKSLNSE